MSISNKKIRVLCSVLSLFSLLAVIPIMYKFYNATVYFSDVRYAYGVWGFNIYIDEAIYIVAGVLGLVALLWDLTFGAYAVIDGKFKPLVWKITRYGYFYGAAAGIINFFMILTLLINVGCSFASILFLAMIALITAAKIVLIFTKEKAEETKQPLA